MALSIRSGITVAQWLEGDPHDLETALLLIDRESEDSSHGR